MTFEEHLAAIPERVRAGIQRNDRAEAFGWRKHIDLDRLDMNICTRCILGQLHWEYALAVHFARLTDADAVSLGFTVSGELVDPSGNSDLMEQYMTALTAEWRRVLALPWPMKCGVRVRLRNGWGGNVHCWTKNGCMVDIDQELYTPADAGAFRVLAVEAVPGDVVEVFE